MQGLVTVKLTVENGQITKVDAVTGATLCSNAIMSAARKAAEEAVLAGAIDLEAIESNPDVGIGDHFLRYSDETGNSK